jgi:hypothetical protein
MIYNLGTTVPLAWNNTVDLGLATLTVTSPDGVAHVTSSISSSAGMYTSTYLPTAAGRHSVVWTAGTTTKGSWQDVFEVRPNTPAAFISLDDARKHLRLRDADRVDDVMLLSIIESASRIVVDITGPMMPTQYTEFFNGGVATLMPTQFPLISVVSLIEYYGTSAFTLTEQPLGAQSTAYGYTVDYVTGQISRRAFGGSAAMFAAGAKNIVLVYTAGRALIPENVLTATKELVRHFYQHTQVPGRPKMSAAGDDGYSELMIGFAVPNFVVEMLQPDRRAPGFA